MPQTDADRLDGALSYAEERRRTLAEEVSKLDAFIAAAKALFGGTPKSDPAPKNAAPLLMDAATMISVVDTMLADHGRPMPVVQLYRKFRQDGNQIGGRDEAQTFAKRISRAKHLFVVLRGYGVWRTQHSCAEIGYTPEATPASDGEEAEDSHPVVVPLLNIRDAYDHFNVLDDDECACSLCTTWRKQRAMAEQLAPSVAGHERSCKCDACVAYRHASVGLWAAVNRRDLWIEMSYHALYDDEMTEPVMYALWNEIAGDGHNVNWWAINGNRFPVGYWLRKVRTKTLTIASGVAATVVAASGFATSAVREQLRQAYTAVAPASWMNEVFLEMDVEAA